MLARLVPILLLCVVACGKDKGKAAPKESPTPPPVVAMDAAVAAGEEDQEAKLHSGGMERFKDPGVYIDGVPTAVLRFGELPISLKPVWIEERAAVNFKKGDKGPRFRIKRERRYRFSDYFREIGVDLAKVKELHIYGGNQKAAAVVVSGKNLREFDEFYFRFGGSIWGKPLPACPEGVGDGKCPDQVATVALYVEKEPPTRKGGYFYFGEELVKGIPYFGEPMRGGIRVYLEGTLAATIKRNRLVASEIKSTGTPGNEEYSLFEFLASQGVDTNKIQEAWIIEYERRTKKISREELLKLRFKAGAGGSGEILIGPNETPAQAISLHSKTLSPDDLPELLPEELEKADG